MACMRSASVLLCSRTHIVFSVGPTSRAWPVIPQSRTVLKVMS